MVGCNISVVRSFYLSVVVIVYITVWLAVTSCPYVNLKLECLVGQYHDLMWPVEGEVTGLFFPDKSINNSLTPEGWNDWMHPRKLQPIDSECL